MNKEKIFKRILQIVFFLCLLAPLAVDRRLFFPYVTGGTLYFRFLAEGLFFAWIIFILLYPKFRPKLNFLNGSALIYILAMAAATIFSVNAYLSFWGDAERMMGLFGFLHIFILFFVGQSVFREKKELNTLLNIFVVVSLIVSVYGILQRLGLTSIKPGEQRIVATLGNADLLASYLIFGLFFAVYLGLKSQKNLGRWVYGAAAFIQLLAIFLTGTRGAFLGIAAGFLFALIFIFKNFRSKKLRAGILAGLGILAVFYGVIFLSQNQDWVKRNSYLYRVTYVSLQDASIQQRLMAWKTGWQGFKEKPVLGYGFENFTVSFNKHFDSRYYNYATEEYFDRAHNIIIELLSTAGVIGLASYILFLAAIFYSVIKKFRRERDIVYFALFGGLLIAYFVQNLFFFDALAPMIGFMALLIFVNNFGQSVALAEPAGQEDKKIVLRPTVILMLCLVFLAGFVYMTNRFILKPYKALNDDAAGQFILPQNYEQGIAYLKRSVSYNTFLDLDLRTAAANTIFNYYLGGGNSQNVKADLDFAISMHKKNLEYIPADTYYNYKLAELLNFRYSVDLEELFRDEAKIYIDKSIATSPRRASLYYILSENVLMAGKFDDGIKIAQQAVDLNDQYGASWWQLTKAYYIKQDNVKTKECLKKTIELGYHLSEQSLERFGGLFDLAGDPQNQIDFFELAVKNGTTNYIYDSTLANLYRQLGNKEEAIYHAERSAELNPAVKEKVGRFIKELQSK